MTTCARGDGDGAALELCLKSEAAKLAQTINLDSVQDVNFDGADTNVPNLERR